MRTKLYKDIDAERRAVDPPTKPRLAAVFSYSHGYLPRASLYAPHPRSRRFAAQAQTAMKRAFGRHKAEMWMYRTDRFLESDLSGA